MGSKAKYLNLVKAVVITLLIFSYMPSSKADEVDTLIQKLKDKESDVRSEAAMALGKIKDPRAVEPLIAALKDVNPDVRRIAAEALGEINDARAVEPLIAALRGELGDVQKRAAGSLAKIGAPAVKPLIATLKDKDPNVRKVVAHVLEEINDARAVKPLIDALKQGDLEVAAGAYTFFIRSGVPGSEAVLIETLEKYGTEEMAENFMNCGNSQLQEAGLKWAKGHGYMIFPAWGRRE